jgi:hypothetical protein
LPWGYGLSNGEPRSDKRLELAYDAAVKSLSTQDVTLGNLRTRANNLLATAALFTSFSTGLGLINTNPQSGAVFSPIKGVILLLVVIALGLCVLYVLWPVKRWVFGASAAEIMNKIDPKPDGQGNMLAKDVDQIRRDVIATLIDGRKKNAAVLEKKQAAFRTAAILLVSEIVLLVVVLFLWNYIWLWLEKIFCWAVWVSTPIWISYWG